MPKILRARAAQGAKEMTEQAIRAIDTTPLAPHPLKLPSLLVSPPTQSTIQLLLTVHLTAYLQIPSF